MRIGEVTSAPSNKLVPIYKKWNIQLNRKENLASDFTAEFNHISHFLTQFQRNTRVCVNELLKGVNSKKF